MTYRYRLQNLEDAKDTAAALHNTRIERQLKLQLISSKSHQSGEAGDADVDNASKRPRYYKTIHEDYERIVIFQEDLQRQRQLHGMTDGQATLQDQQQSIALEDKMIRRVQQLVRRSFGRILRKTQVFTASLYCGYLHFIMILCCAGEAARTFCIEITNSVEENGRCQFAYASSPTASFGIGCPAHVPIETCFLSSGNFT